MGSSPRMRGSLILKSITHAIHRIIPAHAGLTVPRSCSLPHARDHPRACGAHCRTTKKLQPSLGSSPRMRGSRFGPCVCRGLLGIIPAHAGLTAWNKGRGYQCGDHPRACGAHYPIASSMSDNWGSSPRMRGSRAMSEPGKYQAGIIPAHAGLTDLDVDIMACHGDHPRACGAHTKKSQ